MELKEVIDTRRSIRHFNNLQVKKNEVEEIIEAGINAPSAHNRQPWRFVIIENQEVKKEIAEILREKADIMVSKTCEVIEECSVLILVFEEVTNELMDTLSVGACIENMILRATDLGIGSLWIGYIVEIGSILKEKFKREEMLVSAVALGHFDKNPSKRPRKEKEEVTCWIV